ncbi:MAG TPA: lipopolysaccharide heptosyltransferase II [Verrucomicrobiae bacterium]|nr:lipopolysaccharide heptosyltransferase II [Verrucomicrobiae bacterium]
MEWWSIGVGFCTPIFQSDICGQLKNVEKLKILILKPSSLGDVVHALPVLRLLKLHQPHSEIFWWLESSLVPLLADDPDIAGIFSFQRKSWSASSNWAQHFDCVRRMRRERFDLAIDLQGLARSGLFTWLANAETSIGLDNPREGAREGARLYYDVLTPRCAAGTHAVDRYLAVLPQLGVPVHEKFQWLPEHPQIAAQVREKWQSDSARWIALLPGARWNNKRWPVENFAEVVRGLSFAQPGMKFVILGGNADCALGKMVASANPARCLDLTGQTSLLEMLECLRLSELVITNDTGPMHIAAALRKPIVSLFGPTDPTGTGPYGQQEWVLQTRGLSCVPCMKSTCAYHEPLACLRAITPAMVCEKALQRLNHSR